MERTMNAADVARMTSRFGRPEIRIEAGLRNDGNRPPQTVYVWQTAEALTPAELADLEGQGFTVQERDGDTEEPTGVPFYTIAG